MALPLPSRRLTVPLLLACMLASAALLPATAAAARPGMSCKLQTATLRLCGAYTDNYKDCFNAADDQPETRAWLAFRRVKTRYATYELDAGQGQFSQLLRLHKVAGRRSAVRHIQLHLSSYGDTSNTENTSFRNDAPRPFFGALLQMKGRVSSSLPVGIKITMWVKGKVRARAKAQYTYDDQIYNAADGTVEHNGPGGRFWIGGRATRTDVELGSGISC